MENKESIQLAEYLRLASAETVYTWLAAWPQPTAEQLFWGNEIPKEIEVALVQRDNKIVDLGLAAWGTQVETLATLYQRWCDHSVVAAWPPQPSTFPYAVLASILGNVNAAGVIFDQVRLGFRYAIENVAENTVAQESEPELLHGMRVRDFNWLIEHGENDLLNILHSNIGPAIGLLKMCAARNGPYGRIDDNSWLTIMARLGHNKRLQLPAKVYDDGPDLIHWEIHAAFIEAVTISPKTSEASDVFWGIFADMPATVTVDSYIKSDALNAAVSSWNVEVSNDQQHSFLHLAKSDALTHAERVQFHILRHYCNWIELEPNDPSRVRRLAAYAKNPVSGKHALEIGDFNKYAERDGPAFVYATSLNLHIWRDEKATEAMIAGKFAGPADSDDVHRNRAACISCGFESDAMRSQNSQANGESTQKQIIKTVEELKAHIDESHRELSAEISRLKTWLIWGGIVLVGLLFFVR